MIVPFNRIAITVAWFVALGLVALLWSPPSVAMGVFVPLVGLALSGGDARPMERILSRPRPRAGRAFRAALDAGTVQRDVRGLLDARNVMLTISAPLVFGRAQKEWPLR